MNRERAKELLPIIQAFAEGKDIQYRHDPAFHWIDVDEPEFPGDLEYRIKPEPDYRPFNCEELQRIVGKIVKHSSGSISMITGTFQDRVYFGGFEMNYFGGFEMTSKELLKHYVFVDTGDKCGFKIVQ